MSVKGWSSTLPFAMCSASHVSLPVKAFRQVGRGAAVAADEQLPFRVDGRNLEVAHANAALRASCQRSLLSQPDVAKAAAISVNPATAPVTRYAIANRSRFFRWIGSIGITSRRRRTTIARGHGSRQYTWRETSSAAPNSDPSRAGVPQDFAFVEGFTFPDLFKATARRMRALKADAPTSSPS